MDESNINKSKTILIVDDDKLDRYLIKRCFRKTEMVFAIHETSNGEDAIRYILDIVGHTAKNKDPKQQEDKIPSFIFLDLNMPLMNGFEFLEVFTELKNKHRPLAETAIVVISSSDNLKDQEQVEAYSFVAGFIPKGDLSIEAVSAYL